MRTVSPIGGPAAWAGSDVAGDDDWKYPLDERQREALLEHVHSLLPLYDVEDMPGVLGSCRQLARTPLDDLVAEVRGQLLEGRGFALIRRLPVDEVTDTQCELMILCIGALLGIPIHQNPQHQYVVHVRDEGKDFARRDVRAYETAASLNYHSDSSDVVGLLCGRPARSGGISTVVSSVRVHDELVRRDATLAARLHESWPHYNPADGRLEMRPICVERHGELFTHYGRRYLELGLNDPRAGPAPDGWRPLLDAYDGVASDPNLVLNMDFRRGDLQLLNNFKVMHSRTAYVDHPEPELRRHLYRVWLVLPELQLPPEFEDIGIISRSTAFMGCA